MNDLMPLVISLDYDRTYTADPGLWDQFIALARSRGHEVVCVTGRNGPPGPHERPIPCDVICAGNGSKAISAREIKHIRRQRLQAPRGVRRRPCCRHLD